jgi:hypothetical protein
MNRKLIFRPPCRGEEVCVLQWLGELCWRELKLLVAPPIPDRSKVRSQTKCTPLPSKLGVGRGANNLIPENHEADQGPHRALMPTKKKKEINFPSAISCTPLV